MFKWNDKILLLYFMYYSASIISHQGIQFLEAVLNLIFILLNLWAMTGMSKICQRYVKKVLTFLTFCLNSGSKLKGKYISLEVN